MRPPIVAVFEMGLGSHLSRLRPLLAMLTDAGLDVRVFTDRRLEAEVERAGGRFVDLYGAGRSLDRTDDGSPFGSRFVMFAACHAEEIVAEAAAIRPSLVLADTFAVVGPVVAKALDIPHVNVCAGHNPSPAEVIPAFRDNPEYTIPPSLLAATETLRDRFGLEDASPYSWFTSSSSVLNVYCEPPQYLPEETRKILEPVTFFGSLSPDAIPDKRPAREPFGAPGRRVSAYVSLGTSVWGPRHGPVTARALAVIAEALGRRRGLHAILSLGGARVAEDKVAALRRPNVTVVPRVDQHEVLAGADLFFTQNGLSSTHEAVFHRVPMISHPFFFDQPSLARTCERLGFALPLVTVPRAPFEAADVDRVLDRYEASRDEMLTALEPARQWELDVVAARPAVIQRIVDLI